MTRPTTAHPVPKPIGACDMTSFRTFVMDKWQEHKDELLAWEKQLPEYDSAYYFRKHRWFLKKMYQLTKKEVDNAAE